MRMSAMVRSRGFGVTHLRLLLPFLYLLLPGCYLSHQLGDRSDASVSIDASREDLGATARALTGLRWELPCIARDGMAVCSTSSVSISEGTMGGAPGERFDVTLRFRGVVEQKDYVGGRADGLWYEGGTGIGDSWNVYSLRVSDPALLAYVNHGTSGIYACVPVDFTRTIRIAAGADVQLVADSVNDLEIENVGAGGHAIVVAGVPPAPRAFDGQFIQMDVVAVTRAP